jgi:hypothetical protein
MKSPLAGFLQAKQVCALEQEAQPGKVNSHLLHLPGLLAEA